MTHPAPRDHARAWWDAIDRGDFDAAIALMAPGTVIDWPLSNERMPNPDAWKLVNRNYPGRWNASITTLVAEGDTVVTNTEVTDGRITAIAISFFTVTGGLITRLVEYWPETYATPGWRAEWTVPIGEQAVEQFAD